MNDDDDSCSCSCCWDDDEDDDDNDDDDEADDETDNKCCFMLVKLLYVNIVNDFNGSWYMNNNSLQVKYRLSWEEEREESSHSDVDA